MCHTPTHRTKSYGQRDRVNRLIIVEMRSGFCVQESPKETKTEPKGKNKLYCMSNQIYNLVQKFCSLFDTILFFELLPGNQTINSDNLPCLAG